MDLDAGGTGLSLLISSNSLPTIYGNTQQGVPTPRGGFDRLPSAELLHAVPGRPPCRRLKSIPGVGPLISTAVVAAIVLARLRRMAGLVLGSGAVRAGLPQKQFGAVPSAGRASILFTAAPKRQPQPDRWSPKPPSSKVEAVADPMRDSVAKRGLRACADALHGDDGAWPRLMRPARRR